MSREDKTRNGLEAAASHIRYQLRGGAKTKKQLFKIPLGESLKEPEKEVNLSFECTIDNRFDSLFPWTDISKKLKLVEGSNKLLEWVGGPITENEITAMIEWARELKTVSKLKTSENKAKIKAEEALKNMETEETTQKNLFSEENLANLDNLQKSVFITKKDDVNKEILSELKAIRKLLTEFITVTKQ